MGDLDLPVIFEEGRLLLGSGLGVDGLLASLCRQEGVHLAGREKHSCKFQSQEFEADREKSVKR